MVMDIASAVVGVLAAVAIALALYSLTRRVGKLENEVDELTADKQEEYIPYDD